MATTLPISKIKTPDGVVHDFSTTHTIYISDNCMDKLDVTWNITNFSGSVSQISGDDYLLTITS